MAIELSSVSTYTGRLNVSPAVPAICETSTVTQTVSSVVPLYSCCAVVNEETLPVAIIRAAKGSTLVILPLAFPEGKAVIFPT